MERKEILQSFLGRGYQINQDALNYFSENQDKIQKFLDLASNRLQKKTITQETIDDLLSEPSGGVKIVRRFESTSRELSIGDLPNKLSKRYVTLSDMISKKPEMVNLVSINRLSEQMKKFSVIGMIKEISADDRSLVVEDQTGTTSVYLSGDAEGEIGYLVEDEVVGLVCDNEETSENKAVRIVFPDIPLPTKIKTSPRDSLCVFVSGMNMDDPHFMGHSLEKLGDYLRKIKQETTVFVIGDVSKDKQKTKKLKDMVPENSHIFFLTSGPSERADHLPDPVIVEADGVKILLTTSGRLSKYFDRLKTSPENMMLQLLKKRHLSPTFGYNKDLDEDKLIIDEPPDIFVAGSYQEPRTMNYKGVTLISLGDFISRPIFWATNLKTRENIKIDLT